MSGVDLDQAVFAYAWQVIQDHAAGHLCQQCGPTDCERLTWAHDRMERLDEDRDWYADRLLRIRALIRDAEAGFEPRISAAARGRVHAGGA